MIPKALRNLFKEDATTYKEVLVPKTMRDMHAIFKIKGSKETFGLRRECLHGFPASAETSNKSIATARIALGRDIRNAFMRQLVRSDVAQVLHAESLQNDIVRLTFHTPERLNRKALGFVLLTSEIQTMLDNTDIRQAFADNAMSGGMELPLATDHNMRLLKAIAKGYIPGCAHTLDEKGDAPIVEAYSARHFELALPKLAKS